MKQAANKLNEPARKQVARAARVEANEKRNRALLGANVDDLARESWETAQIYHPEFRGWESAKAYFETVFYNEID